MIEENVIKINRHLKFWWNEITKLWNDARWTAASNLCSLDIYIQNGTNTLQQ